MPKPRVTASVTQTKRFCKSAHNNVVMPIATRIKAPPMVGVPAFGRCDCGPSLRTAWPILYEVSLRIIAGPTMKVMTSAVRQASTARSVM